MINIDGFCDFPDRITEFVSDFLLAKTPTTYSHILITTAKLFKLSSPLDDLI